MSTQMTRKEFLIYIGAVLMAIFGISSMMNLFSDLSPRKVTSGFGAGPYGI